MHLRQIVAQFRTGSHRLNIETGRHKKTDRSGSICPLCVDRITNLDVPADCFDAFVSRGDASVPMEDEDHTTHPMFESLLVLDLVRFLSPNQYEIPG